MRTLQLLRRHILLLPLAGALLTGCDDPTRPEAQAEAEDAAPGLQSAGVQAAPADPIPANPEGPAGGSASAIVAHEADAQPPCTIEFTGKAPNHQSTFVVAPGYNVECNATFFPTVSPADPRLGRDPEIRHFHIANATQGSAWANMDELGGHLSTDVIQMTYNDDGTTTFDLLGICIFDGSTFNLGVMEADGSIGVYNNLQAGCWSFSDGSNLKRLTIEGTGTAVPRVENVTIRGHIAETSPNNPPTASAGGPYSGREGVAIQFSSAGSGDPDGDVLSYRWDFGDGTTSDEANPRNVYLDNGTYPVRLTVTGPAGATSTATTTATVANASPVVKFAATSATTFQAGGTLSVRGSFTDLGTRDEPWAYTIVWGDGKANTTGMLTSQGTAITASHQYTKAGTWKASLTIRDKDGQVGTSGKLTVIVKP